MCDQFSPVQNSCTWRLRPLGFCLPKHAHAAQLGVGNPNQDNILVSKRDNKVVHRAPHGNDHGRRWVSGKNLLNTIFACQGCSCS